VGAPAPHQGGEKIFRGNLQGKFVSAPSSTPSAPPGRARFNFRTFFAWRERFGGGSSHLVVLDHLQIDEGDD